jgi:uncharacterized protein (DUF58 family)
MTVTRCRPARPWGAIPGGVAVVLGWWLVAHSSGQGWVQALGDVVAAGILVGLVGPWLALRRIRLRITSAPSDATAGRPVEVEVHTSGPVRLTPLTPAGPPRLDGPLTLLADRRGVYHSVVVEVATAAPFGMQWWSRRVTLPLGNPLYVAPRRGVAARIESFLPDEGDHQRGRTRRNSGDGDLRAPRPYRPGDSRRLAHWPATAHTGELMVRELEQPGGRPAEVVAVLPADPVAAEVEAQRCLATVLALLDRDIPVALTTTEVGGTVTGRVTDRRAASRRLAAAL